MKKQNQEASKLNPPEVVQLSIKSVNSAALEQLPTRPVPNCMGHLARRAKQLFTKSMTRAAKQKPRQTLGRQSKRLPELPRESPDRPSPQSKRLFTNVMTKAGPRKPRPTPSPQSKRLFTKSLNTTAPRGPRPTPGPQSKRLFTKPLNRAAPQQLPAKPVPICMGRTALRKPRPIIHKILEQSCCAATPGKTGTNLHGSSCPAKTPANYSQNP